MGQFDSLAGQTQYVQKLQYALKNLATTQDERWQLQEEIYSAQKAYEEDALKTQEDVISHNESLGKYTGNLVQKYKDLVNVQKQYAKTEEQRKKIDEELYGIQKDIIQQQEDAEKHLVSIGKAAENTLDYVRWIDAEIQRINNTKGLSSGDKKSLTDSLREERYSNMKGYEQSVLDTSLNQELGFREKMGTVGEGTKEALQNYQEIYKNLTTGKTMTLVNNIQNQQEIESDIYSTKKNILESQKTELDNEVSLGNVRENSLEYVQGILKYKQSIEQSDLGAYDKEQALLGVSKDLYSAEKNYVQLLESSLSDESIVGSYGYQIKQIQDKIDAINKQNDSLSKQIALEKAKAAWEEAQNQKSVAVYRQGYGFVYTVDQKNVTEKKEAYEDAERAKRIQDLTDQKDAIEKEMNSQKTALQEASKHLDGYQNDSISSWNSISKQIKNCISDINGAIGLQTSTAQQNYTQQENDLKRQTKAQSVEYNKQLADLNNFYQQYKQITQQNPIDSNLSNIKPAQEQGSDLGSTVDYSDMNQSDSQSQMMQSQNNTIGNMKTHLTQLGTNSIEYGKTMNANYAKGMTENQHEVIKTQAELINQISKNISDFINDCVTYGQNSDNSFATGINNNANVPNTSISNLIQSFEQQDIDYVNENEVYGKQSDENFATGVTNKQLNPQTAVTNVLLALENLDNQYVKKNIQYGYNSDISLGQGLNDKAKIPEKSLQDIVDSLETKLEKFVDKCLGYGQGILKELDNGIKDSKLNKQLLSEVDSLTNKVVGEFKKGFGIASPSKVMYQIGNYLIQGFINGMSATDLNKFIESNLSSFVSTTQRLIKIAASQIGTTDPTKYWDFAGMSGAWCDMFISWCLKQAGIKSDYGSYVPNTLDWYKKNKRFTNTPASGELVFYDWNGDKIPDHIGLVESVLGNGKIKTIEGNTSNPNGGGNGVFEKTRQENSTILGYGIPETGNSSNASGNSGVRDWSSLATLALKLTGHYSNENLKLLLAQINTESSGNPNPPDYKDVNYYEGHPSKGLMQVIPSTFKEYALAPYNKDILDPLSNMIAAIRYTWSRYGGAEGVWGQGHGYASGTDNADAGWHWKNEQGYELMLEPTGQGDFRYINEGSKILTADKTDRLFKFADNPQKYISSSVVDKLSNIKISGENTTPSVINQYSWDKLVLPNVTNAESFIDELQHLDLDATQVITQRN
jgi:SLT domain-containing protein